MNGSSILSHAHSNADGYFRNLFSSEAIACPIIRAVGRAATETFSSHELLADVAVMADYAQGLESNEDKAGERAVVITDWLVREVWPARFMIKKQVERARKLRALPSPTVSVGAFIDAYNALRGKWMKPVTKSSERCWRYGYVDFSPRANLPCIERSISEVAADKDVAYMIIGLLKRLCGVTEVES